MAIADVKEYTHLTEEEVEQLGRELDAIRAEVEESRCDAGRGVHQPDDHGCSAASPPPAG